MKKTNKQTQQDTNYQNQEEEKHYCRSKIMRVYCKEFYVSKFHNLDEMNKFFERLKLPKFPQMT